MSRWFRFYDDAINDPKILKLSDKLHRVWIGMLCAASKNDGRIPPLDDLALMIRMKPEKLECLLKELVIAGLIDDDGVSLSPHNWSVRQYKSDVSTDRVKRFRNGQRNVSETPPETEQSTETEKKENSPNRVRTDYSKEFEEGFWEPYPRTPVMAKKEAWREWLKLSPDDQHTAISAVPRYLAYLKSEPWQKAVHGCRFLSQRRFDGFKADAAKTSQPDWDRWVREYRETNGSRWPWKVAGPEPVMLSCRAPPEILAKYSYGGANVLPLGDAGRSSAA